MLAKSTATAAHAAGVIDVDFIFRSLCPYVRVNRKLPSPAWARSGYSARP
jgi:hypothetical protein